MSCLRFLLPRCAITAPAKAFRCADAPPPASPTGPAGTDVLPAAGGTGPPLAGLTAQPHGLPTALPASSPPDLPAACLDPLAEDAQGDPEDEAAAEPVGPPPSAAAQVYLSAAAVEGMFFTLPSVLTDVLAQEAVTMAIAGAVHEAIEHGFLQGFDRLQTLVITMRHLRELVRIHQSGPSSSAGHPPTWAERVLCIAEALGGMWGPTARFNQDYGSHIRIFRDAKGNEPHVSVA